MRTATPMQTPAARPFMRLVTDDQAEVKVSVKPFPRLRLATEERRASARLQIAGRVQGRRLDHSVEARREPCLNLAIENISSGGFAAVSQTVLAVGEQVCVFFPPEGSRRGWDAIGRVVRCEPGGFGYKVAVEFEHVPSAA